MIQLIDHNKRLCTFWRQAFKGIEDVRIVNGDAFDFKTDCLVAPANSFGFMDGGFDLTISQKMGWQIQKRLQDRIKNTTMGELLVGQAMIMKTANPDIPYLIVAPTMRVPMTIRHTANVYLAAKAIFALLKRMPQIKTITITGLGTGVGKLPCKTCATQMLRAYEEVMLNEKKFPESWDEAQDNHQLLYTTKLRDLQG